MRGIRVVETSAEAFRSQGEISGLVIELATSSQHVRKFQLLSRSLRCRSESSGNSFSFEREARPESHVAAMCPSREDGVVGSAPSESNTLTTPAHRCEHRAMTGPVPAHCDDEPERST